MQVKKKKSYVTMAQSGLLDVVSQAFQTYPPTWGSSLAAVATIVLLGSPVLLSGLTVPGILSAYVLGTVSWRAFGAKGFVLVAVYFILGTAATKVKIAQKEKEGIAEQRKGRRGPSSVWGSGTAGILCALAYIWGTGGPEYRDVWILGFIASFCTKISDTVSSEIGKAYGKTTYLITTLSIVPRGTEGAVSIEGTLAGLIASTLLAGVAFALQEIDVSGAILCVLASQVANLCESYVGATLQGRKGYEWLNNDLVNVLNISIGATLCILGKLALG